MKTVITSGGNDLNASFEKRFGRAPYFCLYDGNPETVSFIANEQAVAHGGAGTHAAGKMLELGVKKVISGNIGPKAKELLEKYGVEMISVNDQGQTIQEMIQQLKSD
jgi:predicted Fe-Mo cluster-binding NifX family protein